jgi:hypothetical protein
MSAQDLVHVLALVLEACLAAGLGACLRANMEVNLGAGSKAETNLDHIFFIAC